MSDKNTSYSNNNKKKGELMKAIIDRDGCISCGLCEATCPSVFRIAGDDLAEVIVDVIPSDSESSAIDAQDACPVSVIEIE